ncbi:MAG: hypothetical protein H6632_15985 [Anaerolineales bacterium]|nr:hypothetical protein [Anaerolineales bacterium]
MTLLERIAFSNGDPQKTIDALRLINQRLLRELELLRAQSGMDREAQILPPVKSSKGTNAGEKNARKLNTSNN